MAQRGVADAMSDGPRDTGGNFHHPHPREELPQTASTSASEARNSESDRDQKSNAAGEGACTSPFAILDHDDGLKDMKLESWTSFEAPRACMPQTASTSASEARNSEFMMNTQTNEHFTRRRFRIPLPMKAPYE